MERGLKKTAPLSHPIMPDVGGDGSSSKQVRAATAAERRPGLFGFKD